MKQILLMFFAVFMIGTSFGSDTKPHPNPTSGKPPFKIILRTPGDSKMHRIPSNIMLEVIADCGYIYFQSADWYTEMSVTVTKEETGESWEGYVTDMTPYIPFDGDEGTYTIDCTTSTGRTLTGGFEI